MTQDDTEAEDESMGSGQAEFLGWLALALMCLMAVAALTLFLAAGLNGFR